jgi:hypothetical protein
MKGCETRRDKRIYLPEASTQKMDELNRGGQYLRLLLHGEVVSQPTRKDEVHGCLQVSSHHLHHTSQFSSQYGNQQSYFPMIHVQWYVILWIRIRSDINIILLDPDLCPFQPNVRKEKLYRYLFSRKFQYAVQNNSTEDFYTYAPTLTRKIKHC